MSSIKYQGKYRIPSARAPFLDYGAEASYFVTICTKGRKHHFGEIRNGRMNLSAVGAIADVLWHQIPLHFPDWELEAFVVMPNHIHGVLTKKSPDRHPVETGHALSPDVAAQPQPIIPRPSHHNTPCPSRHDTPRPSHHNTPHPSHHNTPHSVDLKAPNPPEADGPTPPQPNAHHHPRLRNPGKNTLSTVIGSYKSAVTRHARRLGYSFSWQARFHDHVIRNDQSHLRIIRYIQQNVANWREDCFHG